MPETSELTPARRRRDSRRRTQHPLRRVGIAVAIATALGGAAAPVYAATAATIVTATPTFDQAASDAESAVTAAEQTLADAQALTEAAAASGLPLGDVDATIDTSALSSALAEVEDLDLVPSLMLPERTEDVLVATAVVASAAHTLETALAEAEAAEAQRIAEALAEQKAAAEAEREAAAAAAVLAEGNTVAGAKATAASIASSDYGWGSDQFSCLESLWNKESGWDYQAYNASSGATGIPQALPGSKMASAGSDWQTNATTQIIWGLGYISSRYDTPCGAWSHSESVGWY